MVQLHCVKDHDGDNEISPARKRTNLKMFPLHYIPIRFKDRYTVIEQSSGLDYALMYRCVGYIGI